MKASGMHGQNLKMKIVRTVKCFREKREKITEQRDYDTDQGNACNQKPVGILWYEKSCKKQYKHDKL